MVRAEQGLDTALRACSTTGATGGRVAALHASSSTGRVLAVGGGAVRVEGPHSDEGERFT
jgi:hypothetical protein